ncbi:MAG: MBL fold metallo-hydrolase [Desulfobacterales bacterium]
MNFGWISEHAVTMEPGMRGWDFRRTTAASIFLIVCFVLIACTPKPFDEIVWRQQVRASDPSLLYAPHQKDGKFFNPWNQMGEKSLLNLIEWKISKKRKYTPIEEAYLPGVIPDAEERIARSMEKDFIMWLGHGSFLIHLKGELFLTDPILTERALIIKRKSPPAIPAESLKSIADHFTVIISHNHYDHLDEETIEALPENSTVLCPLGLKEHIDGFDGKKNVIEMDWWQEYTSDAGTKIISLPAQHWSRIAGMGTNKSLWASYMIQSSDIAIYFGGDSGYFIGYREFGKKFSRIDYALMPTTAYHPRWFMYYAHLDIPEAIEAFHELGAKYFIPTQWGAFHLGDEPPGFPALDLQREIKEKQLNPERFLIMDIGEIIELQASR